MSAAESLQSAQRPKQQLSQPHDAVSTEAETALASETCQKPAGAQEPVAQEAEGPTADAKGPTADAKGPTADAKEHPWGTKRPVEDMIQLSRHVLSGSRIVSPQQRQLLLHSRFALFDSDSSSSEDEGNAQQVILSLHHASLTLFW